MMAAFVLPCAMLTACGGDDDDTPGGKVDIDNPEKPILTNTDVEQYIDNSYSPSQSDIQKVWVGDYEGWDANQEKNTKIKRLLTLNANGTYINVIQGILVESGKNDYLDFEHERGTYTYNSSSKTITYNVRTDSILNYGTQQMEGYTQKKYYDHSEGSYSEKVNFSKERDSQRSWISHDMYLQSLTDKTINIAFPMVVQVEDKR